MAISASSMRSTSAATTSRRSPSTTSPSPASWGTGRHGPGVLAVPVDMLKEAAAAVTAKPQEWNAPPSFLPGADPDVVSKALQMLLAAEGPVLLVGQGAKDGGAAPDVLHVAERL